MRITIRYAALTGTLTLDKSIPVANAALIPKEIIPSDSTASPFKIVISLLLSNLKLQKNLSDHKIYHTAKGIAKRSPRLSTYFSKASQP